jgi:iduronate 2-sulfatase
VKTKNRAQPLPYELTLVITALLLGAACATQEQRSIPDHPNVLFIVVDDLNVAIGTYGEYPTAKTPNIDLLASQGVRFDRAYSQDPVCNPSRTSFLSGRRPASTNVYGNFVPPRTTMGDVVMMPEYFAAHGYFTARVGKVAHGRYEDSVRWDISENAWRREHYLPGVDHSEVRDNTWTEGSEDGMSRAEVFEPTGRTRGLPLTWRATDEREEETPDGRTTRRVIEILRQHVSDKPEQPFFIGAGFHKPHQPWVAPAGFFEQHPIAEIQLPDEPADDLDDIPAPALGNYPDDRAHTEDQYRQAAAAYHATITLMDHQVGLLMQTLAELKLEESTIVVFVSDHGFHLGEHGGLWRKHTQWEESTRVPLIVRTPGAAVDGERTSTMGLVELVDLYPTLADLCNLPEKSGLEGTSFSPLLENPSQEWKSAIFSEAKRQGAHGRTIRTARHRYTEWKPLEGDGDTAYELYDLETDPKEYVNLADVPEKSELRAELAAKLEAGWQGALPDSELLSQARK